MYSVSQYKRQERKIEPRQDGGDPAPPRRTDARPLMVKVKKTKMNVGTFCGDASSRRQQWRRPHRRLACPPMRSGDVVVKGASASTEAAFPFQFVAK